MADAPRVFLSYSHDSDEHGDRVLALADALCDRGIDVILDRYVHPAPAEGWPRWMDRNLDEARFVLMVCTDTYRRRVMGREEPGRGLGVRWQGNLIYNRIYHDQPSGSRFISILLPGSEPAHIPDPVRGHAYFRIATFDLTDPGFEALYRHLTDQPATPRPDRGAITTLPPKPRPRPSPGPLLPSGGQMTNVSGNVVGSASQEGAPTPTVGIITALPHESAAVRAVLGDPPEIHVPGSGAGRRYWKAEVPSPKGGVRHVVIAQAGMGTTRGNPRQPAPDALPDGRFDYHVRDRGGHPPSGQARRPRPARRRRRLEHQGGCAIRLREAVRRGCRAGGGRGGPILIAPAECTAHRSGRSPGI